VSSKTKSKSRSKEITDDDEDDLWSSHPPPARPPAVVTPIEIVDGPCWLLLVDMAWPWWIWICCLMPCYCCSSAEQQGALLLKFPAAHVPCSSFVYSSLSQGFVCSSLSLTSKALPTA
jgi:hypothetical protein